MAHFTTEPAAPSETSLDTSTEDEATLTWTDNSSGEDGYRVYRSQDGYNYSQVADLAANTESYTDTGIEDGEKFWYYVCDYTSSGSSCGTTVSGVTVLPAASSLDTAPQSDGDVELTWVNNDDSSDGNIDVKRRIHGSTSWSALASLTPSATSYTDTNVSDDTEYEYRIERTTDHASSTSAIEEFLRVTESVSASSTGGVSVIADIPPVRDSPSTSAVTSHISVGSVEAVSGKKLSQSVSSPLALNAAGVTSESTAPIHRSTSVSATWLSVADDRPAVSTTVSTVALSGSSSLTGGTESIIRSSAITSLELVDGTQTEVAKLSTATDSTVNGTFGAVASVDERVTTESSIDVLDAGVSLDTPLVGSASSVTLGEESGSLIEESLLPVPLSFKAVDQSLSKGVLDEDVDSTIDILEANLVVESASSESSASPSVVDKSPVREVALFTQIVGTTWSESASAADYASLTSIASIEESDSTYQSDVAEMEAESRFALHGWTHTQESTAPIFAESTVVAFHSGISDENLVVGSVSTVEGPVETGIGSGKITSVFPHSTYVSGVKFSYPRFKLDIDEDELVDAGDGVSASIRDSGTDVAYDSTQTDVSLNDG